MYRFSLQVSVWRILLVLSAHFLEYGESLQCYTYNCKSSTPTKCRLFPRWNVETIECSGACFSVRNTSKSFVYVNRGCAAISTPGCRPVVSFNGNNPDDYYHYEACYCHVSLCNGGHLETNFSASVFMIIYCLLFELVNKCFL